jgi:hypothetical protein
MPLSSTTFEWFSLCHIKCTAPDKSLDKKVNSLTHRISHRVAGFLEREGLLVRDIDNDYLALDGLEDDPML